MQLAYSAVHIELAMATRQGVASTHAHHLIVQYSTWRMLSPSLPNQGAVASCLVLPAHTPSLPSVLSRAWTGLLLPSETSIFAACFTGLYADLGQVGLLTFLIRNGSKQPSLLGGLYSSPEQAAVSAWAAPGSRSTGVPHLPGRVVKLSRLHTTREWMQSRAYQTGRGILHLMPSD